MDKEKTDTQETSDKQDENEETNEAPSCEISSNIDKIDKSFELDDSDFDSF